VSLPVECERIDKHGYDFKKSNLRNLQGDFNGGLHTFPLFLSLKMDNVYRPHTYALTFIKRVMKIAEVITSEKI
jgi:hypothetical protein